MAKKSIATVEYRRKREGKTDYRKRLTYLKSQKPRLVIRLTSSHIITQVVQYNPDGDFTKLTFNSKSLAKYGWNYSTNNLPAAYLTGLVIGKAAVDNGINDLVTDMGMQSKVHGARLFAVIKGVVDAGVAIPYSEKCLPSEERVSGQHIQSYAQSIKEDKEKYEKQFSAYLKNNQDPEKIPQDFENTKQKILNSES